MSDDISSVNFRCVCSGAGDCPVFNRHMPADWVKHCQRTDKTGAFLRAKFAGIKGVKPPQGKAPTVNRVDTPKPGDELERLLSKFGKIKTENATCSCSTLKDEMNNNGVEWCKENATARIVPQIIKNIDMIRDDLSKQEWQVAAAITTAAVLPESLVAATLKRLVLRAVKNAETAFSARNKGGRTFASAFVQTGKPQFVSSRQLQDDILKLVNLMPSDVTAIAGVARSGLAVATMLSMYTHLPMLTIRQTMNDIVETGNGWRLGKHSHVEPVSDKVLVVDDTCMTGNSLKAIDPLLRTHFKTYITATVYCNPLAKVKPDIHAVDLPWPHLLEWNLFNSILSPNMACDFDGILCRDCTRGQDDDGPKYLNFIETAQPLYMPRKVAIPLIVTARIEKYRKPTVDWLKRHNITFKKLVMHPAKSTRLRERENIAEFKANHFAAWAKRHRATPPPLGFIESDDRQAQAIAKLSRLMVICPASGKVY
jgi:orotate phosphoribosyltransferase